MGSTTNIMFEPTEHPHRRYNPLTGKHVLVSPHRTKRPWKGQTEEPVTAKLPQHDPECYLCPGNSRSGGIKNPDYQETFVFENDFPALLASPLPSLPSEPDGAAAKEHLDLFDSEPVRGRCKVICFHPRHDLTLARMSEQDIVKVVEGWRGIYVEEGRMLSESKEKTSGTTIAGTSYDGYVQIFENRGSMMGASAPHPHGQVWSLSYVPDEPATELEQFARYRQSSSSQNGNAKTDGPCCLLCSYAAEEVRRKERIVEMDEAGGWMAVIPFWATWPFEIMLLPFKRHIPSLCEMTPEEDAGLARILQKVLVRYDNLFSCPFPYSMGIHQAPLPPSSPASDSATPLSHIHFHFYPPLLRSASVRKFLVGFEMLGEVQRDLTPEQAADRLRALPSIHYLDKQ